MEAGWRERDQLRASWLGGDAVSDIWVGSTNIVNQDGHTLPANWTGRNPNCGGRTWTWRFSSQPHALLIVVSLLVDFYSWMFKKVSYRDFMVIECSLMQMILVSFSKCIVFQLTCVVSSCLRSLLISSCRAATLFCCSVTSPSFCRSCRPLACSTQQ